MTTLTASTTYKALIDFGGFYHSDWGYMIDCLIDRESDNLEDVDRFVDSVDFNKTRRDIAILIVRAINQACDLDLNFVSIISPKFYNFETDKIEVEVLDSDLPKIDALLTELEAWDNYDDAVIEATTERSGYMPFYSAKTLPFEQRLRIKLSELYHQHSNRIYETAEAEAELVFKGD